MNSKMEEEILEIGENESHERDDTYSVGISVLGCDPSQERYKNMLYLVAYDVRDPRRLRIVAKTCLDYGIRVEYSVFECDLAEDSFIKLWKDLCRVIDTDEDAILVYRICGSCVQRIKSLGTVIRPSKSLLYMI
jgi:CRISPR-associated protein Cas2